MNLSVRTILPVITGAFIIAQLAGCAGSKSTIEMPSLPQNPHAQEQSSLSKKSAQENKVPGMGALAIKTSATLAAPEPTIIPLSPSIHTAEGYDRERENPFCNTLTKSLSTYAVTVDAASYTQMRSYINKKMFPPKDEVRIEELINYFSYTYPQPKKDTLFSIATELTDCPWAPEDNLLHVGLQGRTYGITAAPPCNLVFLLDISGSMKAPDKLPLLTRSFRLLASKLRAQDKVAIVVYGSAEGVVLPATVGTNNSMIMQAFDNLTAGGSTENGSGISLAYNIATENFIAKGTNRILLVTDNDFATTDADMVEMIQQKQATGINLSIFGLGMDPLQKTRLAQLTKHGKGTYVTIANPVEASKALLQEIGITLPTLATDATIQVEFNPEYVTEYRLIGYENRLLKQADSTTMLPPNELLPGHTLTALYQLKMKKAPAVPAKVTPQTKKTVHALASVWLQYTPPSGTISKSTMRLVTDKTTSFTTSSVNHRFSTAVASLGMLLRRSKYAGTSSLTMVKDIASKALATDSFGYRAEFLLLVDKIAALHEKK